MTAAHVPLVDLGWQHEQVSDEVADGFAEVLQATDFVGGKAVAAFEQSYEETLGVPRCVGMANGTDALELALRAVGVGAGDEVVLPSNTFIATAEAVFRCGAQVVLCDVDPEYLLLDPECVAATFTSRTKAVVPVHLYGQLAPVEALIEIASAFGIAVVEDAAQAQGATRHGRAAGTFGAAAGTSFYPGKNLGAYGDAGAVLTTSDAIADLVRLFGNHGSSRKYLHEIVGVNSRLDTLQAVVLRAKLRRLAEWNELRREAADRYDAMLGELPLVVRPAVLPGNEHVWHLYVVRVPERDRVLSELGVAGIGAGIHYPTPIHLQPAFRTLGMGPGCFPVTEEAAEEILSLPLFPGITVEQQERVVEELARALP
jgi:dTDP-4-amino-4,6-dideoxygalactose transaminase